MMQLNSAYNRTDILDFLVEYFLPDFKKDIRPANIQGLSSFQKAFSLGRSESLDLQIFEFSFEGSSKKRVTLTKDAFQIMRSHAIFQALAIFHSPGSNDWRLSLMTATPERTEKGKVALTYSNPKRLSFFLGSNAKINTPSKFLLKQGKVIDFEDLKNRFSIEIVNKEFYKEISELFTQLVGGSVLKGKIREVYDPLVKLPNIRDKSQTSLEFAVRLIGRVIFCWFLREKKSDPGKSLMPNDLLSLEAVKNHHDYYHTILEPIFFEVLNKPHNSRKHAYSQEPFSSIPYLNGGLFSPQDDDFFSYNEGKQVVNHNMVVIPDAWIRKFFAVLETYNFTIDENISFDEELSIDPEMLGRIFENLLAEINPETGESARKSSGSYYTPRVIVDYMVDESLLLYLKNQTHIDEEKLRAVISYDLTDDEQNPLLTDERERIINALEKVKILDPACGSGAFPIGALQKIVFILQLTDPEGQLWFKKQIKNTPPELRKMVERELSDKNFDYIRKLGIIRENIYGIDIQPIATEISRLRCFLTLVVDQRIKENVDNRGIEALPNLDFKFVTANSLIGLPQLDQPKDKPQQLKIEVIDDREKINVLKDIRDEYFNASGIEREQLKTAFVMAQKKLVNQLIEEHGYMGVAKAELTQKLTDWEPFTHKPTSWFDPEWMFGIKEGFDIVIANPPYFQIQKMPEGQKETLGNIFTTFEKGGDIYCLFYELSLRLSTNNGISTFITSNSWLKTKYGKPLREYFISNANPVQLVNFEDSQVFQSAIVETNILITQKSEWDKHLIAVNVTKDFKNYQSLNDYIDQNGSVLESLDESGWVIGSKAVLDLKRKIEAGSTEIKDLDVTINFGITTGFNEAFIIDENTKQQLIEKDPKSIQIIKPLLRGRDIKKYTYEFLNKYIIATFPAKHIDIDSYREIKKYLESFGRKLEQTGSQYIDENGMKQKTRKKTGNRWFETQDQIDYYKELDKEKIIWGELSDKPKFAFEPGNFYVEATLFLMTGENLKYILAILNSKLSEWYFSLISSSSGMGTNRWKKYKIELFPLKDPREVDTELVIKIVNQLLEITNEADYFSNADKQAQVKEYEKQIDQMVYELYNLTEEEIRIVEGKANIGSEAEPILAIA